MLKQKLKTKKQNIQNEPPKTSAEIIPQQISNQQDSCLYVKKMLALGISNIAYLRGLLSGDCFTDRMFEDQPVKVLTNNEKSETLKNIQNWLIGAYDAIEKKYLKSMVFAIFEDIKNPNNVLESYQFDITYSENEVGLTLNVQDSKSVTQKAKINSVRMFRTLLITTSTLDNLPEEVYATMKLYYYDDITPPEYEPPFFIAAKNKDFSYDGTKIKIDIGQINSRWHQLRVQLTASEKMVKQIDDYENISVNKNKRKSEKIEERDVDHDNKEVERVAEVEGAFVQTESNQSISSATKYNMNELKKVLNNSQSLYSNEEDVDDDEGDNANEASENEDDSNAKNKTNLNENCVKIIDCPCQLKDENNKIIQCHSCKNWQHSICFKLFDDVMPSKHFCNKCRSNVKDKETLLDKSFLNLNEQQSKDLCLLRRCLYDFIKSTTVNKTDLIKKYLTSNNKDHASWMIKRLMDEGFLKCLDSKKKVYEIKNVEDALKVYFQTDKFKITQTPVEERAPFKPIVNNNNFNSAKVNLNLFEDDDEFALDFQNLNKNETVNLKLKDFQSTSGLNETKISFEKVKSNKKKCSDVNYDYKPKRQKKASDSLKPAKK